MQLKKFQVTLPKKNLHRIHLKVIMKKPKHSDWMIILIVVSISIFITSCNNNEEKTKIRNLIDQIYESENIYRNSKLDATVFTKDLQTLISEAKEVEEKTMQSIPEIERNNIKPNIIEGEIFASLYEGYTSYSILKILLKGNRCSVQVEFSNSHYNEVWTDEIILLNENGWKLDDVVYQNAKYDTKNLKKLLSNFIQKY